MATLSEDTIANIQKLYKEIGTYSGVAKATGCSPATVKKYVTTEVPIMKPEKQIEFTKEIPKIQSISFSFPIENWTQMTAAEREAFNLFKKEEL